LNRSLLHKTAVFLILFLITIFQLQGRAAQKDLRVHFIDVGYGDSILLELPDETTWLIDAGQEASANKLIEHLDTFDIRRIDTAVITHPHQNHFEGFFTVLKEMPIGRVFINGDQNAEEGYFKLVEEFRQKQIPVKILKQGKVLSELPIGVRVEILHPNELNGTPNGNSIVTWLEYENVAMLFTADIEPKEQRALLTNYPKVKQADLVQIPHHGGTLSAQFAQSFVNKIFIISTGVNRWGLPDEDSLRALKGKIYRTDQSGNIVLWSDGSDIELFHE